MDITATLRKLTETPGPSGMEEPIAAVIQELWEPLADEVRRDHLGNVLAYKRGTGPETAGGRRPRLLLAAHMDEIGLMVSQLVAYPEDDPTGYGFLRVTGVGGVDRRHLFGQLVTVHGSQELNGILGALPPRMLPDSKANKPYDYEDLVVDVGLRLEELRKLVQIGDFVSFRQPLRELLNDRVAGKALDNRASVAAVTFCLEKLQDRRHDWDVVAAATIQEETRLLGAFSSAYSEAPEAAVAIDVTFGKGPGAKDGGTVFELDEGPTIGLGPNVHPGLYDALQDAAKNLEMKVHAEPHVYGSGTDAYALQTAHEGVPTGLVSIPLRYMHTMVETLATADVERTGRLLTEFITQLDANFLDKIAKELLD